MKPIQKIKIKDLAKMAGVGTTAVSRYFNARGYLSEATKEKIHKVVQKTGYRLNHAASHLKSSKPNRLAMVMPMRKPMSVYSRHFFGNVKFSSALEECFERHYELLLVPADFSNEEGVTLFEKTLRTGSFSGILFMETFPQAILKTLHLLKLPYVLSNFNDTYTETKDAYSYDPKKSNGVLTDYENLFDALFEEAATQNLNAIALSSFETTYSEYRVRLQTLFKKHHYQNHTDSLRSLLLEQISPDQFLERIKTKTMIVLRQETEVLKLYALLGKKLSGHFYVVAFDPYPSYETLNPKPKIILQNAEEIGRRSVSELISAIEKEKAKFPNILIPAQIVSMEA